MPPRLIAHRRRLVPTTPVPFVQDGLDRRIWAPVGTRAVHYLAESLMQHHVTVRFLPNGPNDNALRSTPMRMPLNGNTARNDLKYIEDLSWFGQDILLVTEYFHYQVANGITEGWTEEHISDFVDWRRKMRFFINDIQTDVAREVAHLREVGEDGARKAPTGAYFVWKAWSWDIVVPMTFRVRHDIARLVHNHLSASFGWESNEVILRAALELCEPRRRFLPYRRIRQVSSATLRESQLYLRTQRQRQEADHARQSAWHMNLVWDNVENEIKERMDFLWARFNSLAEDLLHLTAMNRELRAPTVPSDEE